MIPRLAQSTVVVFALGWLALGVGAAVFLDPIDGFIFGVLATCPNFAILHTLWFIRDYPKNPPTNFHENETN